jgi:hypothetical protein
MEKNKTCRKLNSSVDGIIKLLHLIYYSIGFSMSSLPLEIDGIK